MPRKLQPGSLLQIRPERPFRKRPMTLVGRVSRPADTRALRSRIQPFAAAIRLGHSPRETPLQSFARNARAGAASSGCAAARAAPDTARLRSGAPPRGEPIPCRTRPARPRRHPSPRAHAAPVAARKTRPRHRKPEQRAAATVHRAPAGLTARAPATAPADDMAPAPARVAYSASRGQKQRIGCGSWPFGCEPLCTQQTAPKRPDPGLCSRPDLALCSCSVLE